ncbi:hypothetical protein ATCC90586_006166 [Pythium insidiosum]|nr:hypothetical protein ATCC90586_006166 [Pythium insidiosum]
MTSTGRSDYRAALVSLDSAASGSSLDSMLDSLRRSIASSTSRQRDHQPPGDDSDAEDDDDDAIAAGKMHEVGVSPMPKLMHAPRAKPSLLRLPTAVQRKPPPATAAHTKTSQKTGPRADADDSSSDSLSLGSSIEPPDTLTPQRHASIDDVIHDDLQELHRLVASTTSLSSVRRSQTTERITDAIRQHTQELYRLRASLLKEKKEQEDKDKKQKEEATKEQKASEEPGANLASMRDAVDAIDKSLLLAMRPFEKMREALDKEDAEKVAAEAKALGPTELPMATQAIVDRLEETFGSMTRQREDELKAEADAAAAAKAEEEAKAKEEAAAKAAAEREEKQREHEILSLLPLQATQKGDECDDAVEEPVSPSESFGDIVQQEVVEKLELTILKLKHLGFKQKTGVCGKA